MPSICVFSGEEPGYRQSGEPLFAAVWTLPYEDEIRSVEGRG